MSGSDFLDPYPPRRRRASMTTTLPVHLRTGDQALDTSNRRRYTLLDAETKSRRPRLSAAEIAYNGKGFETDEDGA